MLYSDDDDIRQTRLWAGWHVPADSEPDSMASAQSRRAWRQREAVSEYTRPAGPAGQRSH
jgi:hypothetical protein